MWLNVNDSNDLQEGDIIELNTEYPLVLHYAVVVDEDGERKVAHYPYPQTPRIEDLDYVLNNRPDSTIRRIMRTGIDSEYIIQNHNEIKDKIKNDYFNWLLKYNCENYIKDVTGAPIDGTDQRITAILVLLVIILIIVAVK